MTAETRTQLKANITAQLADNVSGDISAEDVRENMLDAADSALFPEDLGLDDLVYVSELSDLPAAVAGVITLETDKGYLVIGEVDLGTDIIDVDGAAFVYGFASAHAKLETNNAGSLLTGGAGGTLRMRDITLENSHASGTLFDFQGSDTEIVLLRNIVPVAAGGGIGTFDRLAVFALSLSNIVSQTGGITLTNTNAPASGLPVCVIEDNLVSMATGTFIDFGTSRWQSIDIESNSVLNVASGATLIDGAASDANFTTGFGRIKDNGFSGAGTYINGITNTDLRWTFSGNTGNNGTEDTLTIAETYISTPAATTISVATTPVVIAGTFTEVDARQFTTDANGRMTYVGLSAVELIATAAINAEMASGGTKTCSFYIGINGTVIASSQMQNTLENNAPHFTQCQALVSLTTNDYIEVFTANEDDTINIQANKMTVIAKA